MPRAVIFDMDGTLTEPLLDFDRIRSELGLPRGVPVLEAMESFDQPRRRSAEEVLRRHELDAIHQATLADGCAELLARLDHHGVPYAILTRSIREAVELLAARFGLRFAAVHTREDGAPKPSPEGVRVLCRALGVRPAETLAVGDYKYDIIAGRRAGCRTALVRAAPPQDLADWGPPDLVVGSLRELLPLWPVPVETQS